MRLDTNLLNNVYKNDPLFMKLKEIYDKWKNHNRREKHIAKSQKDIILLKLTTDFTKIPNILINQLTEVNFSCKDCFKAFLIMYRFSLIRNNMRFKCKKEYLRKMIKVHRTGLERILKELQEKNMLFMDKSDSYFYFTLNLCFVNWEVSEYEKEQIRKNNEETIEKYDERYILDEDFL